MNLISNQLYIEDVRYVASLNLDWEKLREKSIIISGATGLIGSFLIDVIAYKNKYEDLNCTVYALSRNFEKAKERFDYCFEDNFFKYICYDVTKALPEDLYNLKNVDYILHLASNTHPIQYATDPIGTILTNLLGTKNLLDLACLHNNIRCAIISSNEIYGENRGDVEFFDEKYCGYIECNSLRAGYPESKRCSEALCQAYIHQKGLDIVIPRVTRCYGPTLLSSDSKALSQFIHKALNHEDIILKSKGFQYYSYIYVADAVSAILTILLKGDNGQAYNISDLASDITLKDLAQLIADYVGKSVRFEIPDEIESAGYSKATKARLSNTKLKALGWNAKYNIKTGIERTIDLLSEN